MAKISYANQEEDGITYKSMVKNDGNRHYWQITNDREIFLMNPGENPENITDHFLEITEEEFENMKKEARKIMAMKYMNLSIESQKLPSNIPKPVN